MGGSLGFVFVNIIMMEFEEKIVMKFIDLGIVKFYCRYVDDIMLLVNLNLLFGIFSEFYKFDKNIWFIYDCFDGVIFYFLDIEIVLDGFSIYRKDMFICLYINFKSFVFWFYWVVWVKFFIYCVFYICVLGKVNVQLFKIR